MRQSGSLVGLILISTLLFGCGGGGGGNSGGTTFKTSLLSGSVIPSAFAGSGTVCSSSGVNASYQTAPQFATVDLPFYSSQNSNQNVAYGVGARGAFAGYAYASGQSLDFPIYWSSAAAQPIALKLPSGSPSMIASISGTNLYGYTTGVNSGGSFGLYQWASPSSQPILFSSNFPAQCTISLVFPNEGNFVVDVSTNQAETLLCRAGGSAPTLFTDGSGASNVTATAVGSDGTVYGLSSTGSPIYWQSGKTSAPKSFPTYNDPSFSGALHAVTVFVNAKNQVAATFIGSDGNFRSCLWTTRTAKPFDLGKQPFGISASAAGPSIAMMALFDDGSLVARTGNGADSYFYLTRKS